MVQMIKTTVRKIGHAFGFVFIPELDAMPAPSGWNARNDRPPSAGSGRPGWTLAAVTDDGAVSYSKETDPFTWDLSTNPNDVATALVPFLTDADRKALATTTNPRLNEATAGKIKPLLAAGKDQSGIARETGLALDTVKKYAAILRRVSIGERPSPIEKKG